VVLLYLKIKEEFIEGLNEIVVLDLIVYELVNGVLTLVEVIPLKILNIRGVN
jgi:hypothetical protein